MWWKERQRIRRNKRVSVDKSYVNSGFYRKKFDNISESKKLNRLLYKLAKKMLRHRTGSLYEDMYWIDMDTCKIITKEINAIKEEQIVYSKATERKIKRYSNIVTIHSHPNSYPPSIDDLNSNFWRKYKIGVVVGHNGSIFLYSANEKISIIYYQILVEEYLKEGYNELEAQKNALNEITDKFDVSYKEVI